MTEHTVDQLLAKVEELEVQKARLEEMIEHYGLGPEPDLIMSPAKPGSVAVIPGDGSAYLDEQTIQPDTKQEIKPPEVYRVEDGHPFEVSPWPSMKGKCHLCGHPETMHMQTQRKVEDLNPWSHD